MIYFVQNEGTGDVKIGFSVDPRKRFRTLRTSIPDELVFLGVIEGDRALERDLHRRFAEWHLAREWFACDDDMLAAIQEILRARGVADHRNVQDQLTERGDCRYGLTGLKCQVDGVPGKIISTRWLAGEGNLEIVFVPWPACDRPDDTPCEIIGNWKLTRASDVKPLAHRFPELQRVPPSRVFLTEPWPITCCTPIKVAS